MIKVWDPFIRIFHWSLAISFLLEWLVAGSFKTFHMYLGYFIGFLVLLRVTWGFIGPKYAKFNNFIYSKEIIINYLKSILTGKSERYIGHNPLGGLNILILLILILSTGLTGWMQTQDIFWGNSLIQGLHSLTGNSIWFFVALHLLGVVFSSILHKENLVKAMITGKKIKT